MTKKYNHIVRRITCPVCGVPNVGVRETGAIWEHMPGRKGLVTTTTSSPDFPLSRGRERCLATGLTEKEAIAMSVSENKTTPIPGVRSHAITEVNILRLDVKFPGIMQTYEMVDGSRKILITSPTQPYIEITVPAKEGA